MPAVVCPPLATTGDLKATPMNLFRRFAPFATVVALGILVPRTVSAGLIMRIDTDNKTFFMEGSDTGNFSESNPSEYRLQFIHYFSTMVPQNSVITPSPQSLFVEEAAVNFGQMDMVSNAGQNYVFMDFFSSSDITTLTGKGPSAALSYGGLPEANIPLFESLIGQTLALSQGTGYSAISVQAVPEPSTYCMALVGLGFTGYSMWRRRRRSLTGEPRPSTSQA